MPWINGAGSRKRPREACKCEDGGPAALGAVLLRHPGSLLPRSLVSMVSIPTALGTAMCGCCAGEHGRSPCSSPCPTPPTAARRHTLGCRGPRPICARGCAGESSARLGRCRDQLHLLLAAESRPTPAERSPLSGLRETGTGGLNWDLGVGPLGEPPLHPTLRAPPPPSQLSEGMPPLRRHSASAVCLVRALACPTYRREREARQ